MLFTEPALDSVQGPAASRPGSFGKFHTRVRGLPEFGGELPVAALAEEIETAGAGQVRALVTVAGNPVLSTPNGRRLDAALDSLDFMVSVDIYLNETTRHADVILPPTSALEHDHYDLIFHHFAVRNTARFNAPLFEKAAARCTTGKSSRPSAGAWRKSSAAGEAHAAPAADRRCGSESQCARAVGGEPAGRAARGGPGALRPTLPGRLVHDYKRINAAPTRIFEELARFAAALREAVPDIADLRLIGRRHVRSNNSWMHNSHRLVKGAPRHQLLMHPDDARARGWKTDAWCGYGRAWGRFASRWKPARR